MYRLSRLNNRLARRRERRGYLSSLKCLSRLFGEKNAISFGVNLAVNNPAGGGGLEMLAQVALLSVFRRLLVHDRFLRRLLRHLALSISAAGDAHSADRAEAESAELQNVTPRGLLAVVFHGSSLIPKLLVVLGRFPVLIGRSPLIRERGGSHENTLAPGDFATLESTGESVPHF